MLISVPALPDFEVTNEHWNALDRHKTGLRPHVFSSSKSDSSQAPKRKEAAQSTLRGGVVFLFSLLSFGERRWLHFFFGSGVGWVSFSLWR